MTISEYARANGLDPDTALTHVLLFTVVEATKFDEDWQRRTFKMLLDAVKPAASRSRSMSPPPRGTTSARGTSPRQTTD